MSKALSISKKSVSLFNYTFAWELYLDTSGVGRSQQVNLATEFGTITLHASSRGARDLTLAFESSGPQGAAGVVSPRGKFSWLDSKGKSTVIQEGRLALDVGWPSAYQLQLAVQPTHFMSADRANKDFDRVNHRRFKVELDVHNAKAPAEVEAKAQGSTEKLARLVSRQSHSSRPLLRPCNTSLSPSSLLPPPLLVPVSQELG